jgi:hypothetical protein
VLIARISPRAGIRGFATWKVPVPSRWKMKSFSPRAGIRGFDTYPDAYHAQSPMFTARCFSPRAGIRGFDTNMFNQLLTFLADPTNKGKFQSPSGDSWL